MRHLLIKLTRQDSPKSAQYRRWRCIVEKSLQFLISLISISHANIRYIRDPVSSVTVWTTALWVPGLKPSWHSTNGLSFRAEPWLFSNTQESSHQGIPSFGKRLSFTVQLEHHLIIGDSDLKTEYVDFRQITDILSCVCNIRREHYIRVVINHPRTIKWTHYPLDNNPIRIDPYGLWCMPSWSGDLRELCHGKMVDSNKAISCPLLSVHADMPSCVNCTLTIENPS